jgi:hypothetical protein
VAGFVAKSAKKKPQKPSEAQVLMKLLASDQYLAATVPPQLKR